MQTANLINLLDSLQALSKFPPQIAHYFFSPQLFPQLFSSNSMPIDCTIHYHSGADIREIAAQTGENLRQVLLRNGISPYARITRRFNCGGRGWCATCGVLVLKGETPPQHWHDRMGNRFGYSRLSCQITITGDMVVAPVPDKWIWGGRKKNQSM